MSFIWCVYFVLCEIIFKLKKTRHFFQDSKVEWQLFYEAETPTALNIRGIQIEIKCRMAQDYQTGFHLVILFNNYSKWEGFMYPALQLRWKWSGSGDWKLRNKLWFLILMITLLCSHVKFAMFFYFFSSMYF